MGVGLLIMVVLAAALVIASGVWVAVALLRALADLNRQDHAAHTPVESPSDR